MACQVLKGLLNSSYLHMLYPSTLTASLSSHVCLAFSFYLSLHFCRFVFFSTTNSQSPFRHSVSLLFRFIFCFVLLFPFVSFLHLFVLFLFCPSSLYSLHFALHWHHGYRMVKHLSQSDHRFGPDGRLEYLRNDWINEQVFAHAVQ